MNFCHRCRQELTLGREKFCPNCGENLQTTNSIKNTKTNGNSLDIKETHGHVIGPGTSGTGNFIGKEIRYSVLGNMFNVQVTGALSNEVIENLNKMMSVETQLPSIVDKGKEIVDKGKEIKNDIMKLTEIKKAQEKITNVLNDVKEIEKIEGTQIEEINAGELQVSKKDLLVKHSLIKGSLFYYSGQYDEALKWYDETIALGAKKVDVWYNKGVILGKMEKYRDAIRCFDKAIEIKPDYAQAWYSMGVCFGKLKKYKQASKCFDRVRTIGMLVQ